MQEDAAAIRARSHNPGRRANFTPMTKLEDIEKAVEKLPPAELARFRAWFDEFDAARFDEKIERDAKAGKLDRLAEQAISDYRNGRAREL